MREIGVGKAILKYPSLLKASFDPLVDLANGSEDCFAIKGGGQRTIVLNDPDLIEFVLKEKPDLFSRPKGIGQIREFLDDGIFGRHAEEWSVHRKELQPVFRPTTIHSIWPDLMTHFDEFIHHLKNIEGEFDLEEEIKCFTFQLIFKVYLYKKVDYKPHEVVSLVDDLVEFTNATNHSKRELKSAYKSLFGVKYKKADMPESFFKLKQLASEIYDLAAADSDSQGLLFKSMFTNVSRTHLEGEICTLLIAGYDTVASGINWMLFELIRNPECLSLIKKELDGVRIDSPDFMRKMNFSKDFIYETLRLYPSVPVLPRVVLEKTECKEVSFKVGDVVFISPFVFQRSSKHWNSPLDFNPNRFKDVDGKFKARYFIPFGTGKMTCVGNNLAITLMSIALKKFSENLAIELVDKDYEPGFIVNTILKAKKPFMVKVIK